MVSGLLEALKGQNFYLYDVKIFFYDGIIFSQVKRSSKK